MIEKIVVVTRRTRLEELVARFNTRDQARFYIEHAGADFGSYQAEHDSYQHAVGRLMSQIASLGRTHLIERSFLPNYLFSDKDLVVTVGQDGLVVNTAKYLDGQPIVAVNPDPDRIDGILLPFRVEHAPAAILRVMEGKAVVRRIVMAQAQLNDGQRMLAFNDLFIGVRTHTSARYVLSFAGRSEPQSSSGIIVSTGAGSTGWLSSLFNMAAGVGRLLSGAERYAEYGQYQRGAKELVLSGAEGPVLSEAEGPVLSGAEGIRLDWEAEQLVFVVREPFVSKTSAAGLAAGVITPGNELVLESRTPEGGVIFSDGVEADYLGFNAGAIARVGIAGRRTHLVVPARS